MSKSVRAIGLAIFLLSSVARADEAPEPPPAGPPAGTVMSQPALGSELRISRDDAIRLALENNLNLIIARTGPELAQQQVERAGGAFDPQLYLDHEFEQNENPVFSPFQILFGGGQTSIDDKQWLYSGGFAGLVPAGVTYSSAYNVSRVETSSAFSALTPEWRGDWESELRIPVLKNLFSNPASVTVERSEIGLDISVEDFREDLMDEVRTVEFAYWELGAARAEEGVAQKSLQTARDLLEQTRVRYEVGVVSKVLVTQAEAGVAEREVTAIVALNRAEGAEDALLDLIAAPTMEEFESTRLVVDDPTFVDYTVEPDVIIRRAMRLRPELQIARKRVEDAEVQLQLAQNQVLPSLDLVASYRLSGLAGKSTSTVATSPFPTSSSGVTDDFFLGQPEPQLGDRCALRAAARERRGARGAGSAQDRAAALVHQHEACRAGHYPRRTRRRARVAQLGRLGSGLGATPCRVAGDAACRRGAAASRRLDTVPGTGIRGRPDRVREPGNPVAAGLPERDHGDRTLPGHPARDPEHLPGARAAATLSLCSVLLSPSRRALPYWAHEAHPGCHRSLGCDGDHAGRCKRTRQRVQGKALPGPRREGSPHVRGPRGRGRSSASTPPTRCSRETRSRTSSVTSTASCRSTGPESRPREFKWPHCCCRVIPL